MFWFFGHPEVYILALPGFGIVSEIIPVFCRRPLFGYKTAAAGMIGVTLLSFFVWQHHLFNSGINPDMRPLFMLTTELISIPTGFIYLVAMGTFWRAKIRLTVPMLFALGMYFNFLIGGISGVFLSDVPADATEHGSFFVMAHFHYAIMGGLIFAFMGGIYYWLPKMTGLKMNEMLGKVQFWTMFIFFNATFLPLFAAGMLGQPRRVFEYAKSLETLNDWVSISAFLLGGSILIFLINFIWSTVIVREPELGNPWQSRGLEWQVPSPPPPGNFARVPVVLSAPYEYGVPGAPPVADLSPPPGVIADEADFYHEASLNAGWAATRLALGALTFLFGTFLFAYFYLRSTNSFGRWEGSGYHPPQLWAGTLIMALIVAGAGLHTIVLQRMKAGHKAAWQAGAAIALAFGVAAVCLQIWQLLNLPFYPGSSGFSSVFTGFYPVFLFIVFAAMFWLETLVVRARSIPAISFVQQPSTRAEASAVQRFEASLSGFGIVWNYLAAVAVVFWILFYVVA